jgi:hypothetical protein
VVERGWGRICVAARHGRNTDALLLSLGRALAEDMKAKRGGTIAIPGFAASQAKCPKLTALVDQIVASEFAGVKSLQIVERERIERVLSQQSLNLSDLMDTSRAIDVGKMLRANYIFTGAAVETSASVLIFGRVIKVGSGQIETAKQVKVPKSEELGVLLQ